MLRKTGFVSGCRVLMKDALVHHFIDDRDGWREQFAASGFIVPSDGRPQFLDLRAQPAAIASIYLISSGVLPYPLLC
nr:hypothetical protein [Leptolyngbya sp. 7M]